MQKRLGNVVEPITLIKRFGADSIRLAYLLCLNDNFQQEVTFSQDRFNQANQALYRFVSKLTNIVHFIKKVHSENFEETSFDKDILEKIESISENVKDYYMHNRFYSSAKTLVNTIEDFTDYCNKVVANYNTSNSIGNAKETIIQVLSQMKTLFSPICPYHFDKLELWVKSQFD
jgi:valyl-tRNA synthetase